MKWDFKRGRFKASMGYFYSYGDPLFLALHRKTNLFKFNNKLKEENFMKKIILLSFLVIFIPAILYGQDKVEAPVWSVGDKWTWKRVDGATLYSEVVDVKEDLYVLKMGRDPDLYGYDKKTMNVKFLIKEGGRQEKFESAWRNVLDFPMFVEKKWTNNTYSKPARGQLPVTYINEFKVEGVEDVTIPAGTFKCYKIRLKQTNMSSRHESGWVLYWYSPEVKIWIKREAESTGYWLNSLWTPNAELISYKLK